jgi:hypothetical protein
MRNACQSVSQNQKSPSRASPSTITARHLLILLFFSKSQKAKLNLPSPSPQAQLGRPILLVSHRRPAAAAAAAAAALLPRRCAALQPLPDDGQQRADDERRRSSSRRRQRLFGPSGEDAEPTDGRPAVRDADRRRRKGEPLEHGTQSAAGPGGLGAERWGMGKRREQGGCLAGVATSQLTVGISGNRIGFICIPGCGH